jgi:RNA polymerase sigma factor (sigma-70 family)
LWPSRARSELFQRETAVISGRLLIDTANYDRTLGGVLERQHVMDSKTNKRVEPCPDFARAVREASADVSLFSQVVDCFQERLSRFAAYTCRNRALGEDAFQDAMVAALDNFGSYRGDAPIEPWLRRIVVSACSRLKRGRKNSPAFNLPLDDEGSSAAAASVPEDQELRLALFEGLRRIVKEIAALEEPNRSLLLAHDIDDVSIEELARRFEMTEEAVKSRLKRARAAVRERVLEGA